MTGSARITATAGLAISLLVIANLAGASDPRSIRFEHISRDRGLSQSFVYDILQDRDGFMWFATQEGLNYFNGYEFSIFSHDPDDPSSLSDESVRTIVEDNDDVLWVGSDAGGLSRFDKTSRTFTNFLHDPEDADSIASNQVRVLYPDRSGTLWIGTDGAGLDRFDPGSSAFVHYPSVSAGTNGPNGASVWSIVEDSKGALWIGTNAGLNRLDPATGAFEHYGQDADTPSALSNTFVRTLFEDRHGRLWVGTGKSGLYRLDYAAGTIEHFVHDPAIATSLSSDRVNDIFEDEDGVLWIGTLAGLNAWNPNTQNFERYIHDPDNPYSLAHDNVLSIYQDRGGVLWIGSYDGLSLWSPATRAMAHYKHDPHDTQTLSENTVTAFAEDADGSIWVGTFSGGLGLLNRETDHFRHLRHKPANADTLSSDQVMALHVDRSDTLWVGTRGAGLNRYDRVADNFVRYQHDPADTASLSVNNVSALLEDSRGRLWIGTFGGGLNQLDRETGRFRHFRHDPDDATTLSNDRVLFLFEDAQRILWIGTFGGGLNRFDTTTGTFTSFRADPDRAGTLSGDDIMMIEEDALGGLWIGTKSNGLNYWRPSLRTQGNPVFEHLGEADGLPSATIYSGVWDDAGSLWLSTANGLSRLDVSTGRFQNFDTSHGLQDSEFNHAAGFRAADGELFFGGMNGFNAFRPEAVNTVRRFPPVAITNVLSMNQPLSVSKIMGTDQPLVFGHDQNVLTFEFAALDYSAVARNRYRYQLRGFDSDWIDAGTQRQVTYINLPAGDYSFRVKAANNVGVWSEQDALLPFRVKPAPWLTWWALAAYGIVLTTLLFLAYRNHNRKLQQAARLRHADDLSIVQSRLKEAQRIAGIGNFEWNTQTNELWWSDEIYRLFMAQPDSHEETFEGFLEYVHPDDRDAVNKTVEQALVDKKPYSIDYRIVRRDGSERIVTERGEVQVDETGTPTRLAGTVLDISDRKRAENEIRHHAEFQVLLASLSSELLRAEPEDIDQRVKKCLATIGERYDLDIIAVWRLGKANGSLERSYHWARRAAMRQDGLLKRSGIPWIAQQILAHQTVAIDDVNAMPKLAVRDRESLRRRGVGASLVMPILINERLEGACAFSMYGSSRHWSNETIAELRLLAESLSGSVARSRAIAEIKRLQEQLQEENLSLHHEITLAHSFDEIIGEDPGLKRCLHAVEKVAPTDAPVLILGETGTGKELIARATHRLSTRRDKPMISVNCPALPAEIIESELFGHEAGAFTGASSRRRGRFELADGGTLFLDEIGELPLELQAKLLRVLQTGEFERLGGTRTLKACVRLIAATNRDLRQAAADGQFRPDLYYRISSFPVQLPPLRARKDDIPLLAEYFVHKHAARLGKKITAISARMLRDLMAHDWPGNVRELESTIERALISTADSPVLELPAVLRWSGRPVERRGAMRESDRTDLFAVERAHIIQVLDETAWKIAGTDGAASVLGIPPSTLRSKMKRLGISRQD